MRAPGKTESSPASNSHEFREPWLHDAVNALRPVFQRVELIIPSKIRCAFSLTSSGVKSARKGECWPVTASADGHHEIFISPDIADPLEVLGILSHELVHACLPDDAGHGTKYKDAATRLGLQGKMRHAMPGPLLTDTLTRIAETLGPLPHARLDIQSNAILDRPIPADRPKKQGTRMIKCECQVAGDDGCMVVRVSAKWIKKLGPPHCPTHGPMVVDKSFNPDETSDDGEDQDQAA